MNYIKRSLDIIQGKIKTDINSYNHALKEIKQEQKKYQPLLKECESKGIELISLSTECAREIYKINYVLRLIELIANTKESVNKSQLNYDKYKSFFYESLLKQNLELLKEYESQLLNI